jgi:ABC-type branched-subunit amino acid transport system substrate-binding protein
LALSRDLLADQDAAGFAAGVKLRVTVFDFPNDTPMYIDFEKAIMAPPYNAALPNVYSATTYDACILAVKAAKAIYDQGCPGSVNWDDTVTSLSAETEGVTGLLTVDDRGIRTAKNYAVWGLTREKPYAWKQEQSCIYEDSSKDSSEPFKCGTAH